jgi:hypothetical protein
MSTHLIVVGHRDPVFRALGRRKAWLFAAVGAAMGGVVGALLVFSMPQRYQATVAVELTQISPQVNTSGTGPGAAPVTIDTDAQLVTSDAVVNAIAFTSRQSPSEVRSNLTVAARPLTQVITLTYTDESAGSALSGAQTAAVVFLETRDLLILRPVRNHLDTIAEQDDIQSATSGTSSAAETNEWAMELRRQAALASRVNLQSAGDVLENARLTSNGEREDVEVPLASAIGLGALAGLAVAVVRDRGGLRRRHREPESGSAPWE